MQLTLCVCAVDVHAHLAPDAASIEAAGVRKAGAQFGGLVTVHDLVSDRQINC